MFIGTWQVLNSIFLKKAPLNGFKVDTLHRTKAEISVNDTIQDYLILKLINGHKM